MPSASFDLDLRVLRYAVCVADCGGFGRAASMLRISQPSLSRQIRSLEQHLGTNLFDRTPAGARLTVEGEAFLPHARGLLRAAADAVAAVSGKSGGLTIATAPGLDVSAAVQTLRDEFPAASVHTRYLGWRRPGETLLGTEFDVVVARLPFPQNGITVDRLYDEPRLVAMHARHRLAGCESVTVADLAGEPLPDLRGLPDDVRAFWSLASMREADAPVGPVMDVLDDTWQMVLNGDVLAVVTASQARAAGPDVVLVPLSGVPPATVVSATRTGDPSPLVTRARAALQEPRLR
ncbi:LysR family transcriptional regulator [Rhodococcus sp. 06-418-5]|uniref:LysR family transcriptional regulator n=1 Tax=Rhodococcus sp. 06-418-5 TaxID=2022507 RepID=UPI00211AF7AC|nr:LysR family transcriptional regulator [Rhodococcus sp. 06-418-5]